MDAAGVSILNSSPSCSTFAARGFFENGGVRAFIARVTGAGAVAASRALPTQDPAGVNIPQNFAILNNVSLESNRLMRWRVRRSYRKLAGEKDGADKENPNGNASLCIDCGKCLEKCPQEINIPVELEKVHAILGQRGRISDHFPEA